jgi:hypothetical protein
MEIYDIFKEFFDKDGIDCEIKSILKVGSSIYWNDPIDNDFLAVVKDFPHPFKKYIAKRDNGIVDDYFVVDENYYISILNLEIDPDSIFESLCWLNPIVVKPENVIYGENVYVTKFMQNEDYIKKTVSSLIEKFGLFSPKNGYISRDLLPKVMYHIYLMLTFLKNKNTEISSETLSDMSDIRKKKEGNISIKTWIEEELKKRY